jgi:hypothetical protein
MTRCKRCIAAYQRNYAHGRPGLIRNANLRRLYGITEDDYQRLLAKQYKRCAICNKSAAVFHIDHCHETKSIRGLLCAACNTGLGHFQDKLELLQRACDYLARA